MGRTHKLKVLGAKTKKAIGNELLEEALENDDELDLPTDEANPGMEVIAQLTN